jgi:HTH-type transcriptional regulator / antitoxin HigA
MERKSSVKAPVSTWRAPARDAYRRMAAERPPKAIHTEQERRNWKRVLDRLMARPEAELTPAEARYAETVALLIEAYEKRRYPLPPASPAGVLAELAAAHGLKQKELADIFGSEAAVSYAMKGKRNLTVDQIRGLAARVDVSPAVFV